MAGLCSKISISATSPTALDLCHECTGIVIGNVQERSFKDLNSKRHHDNLVKLKSCAESRNPPCLLCRLLWATVQRYECETITEIKNLLRNWPSGYILMLANYKKGDQKLKLCVSRPLNHNCLRVIGTLDIFAIIGKFRYL